MDMREHVLFMSALDRRLIVLRIDGRNTAIVAPEIEKLNRVGGQHFATVALGACPSIPIVLGVDS